MPLIVTMPALSPTMERGTIQDWKVKEGDFVKEGDLLCLIQTDKATLEYEAVDPGFLRKIMVHKGTLVEVGMPIALFTETKEEPFSIPEAPKAPVQAEKPQEEIVATVKKESTATVIGAPSFVPEPPPKHYRFSRLRQEEIKASPLAKKIAAEKNLDLKTVKGSGPGGRVVEADLALAQKKSIVAFGDKGEPLHGAGTYEEIPLTPIRSIIGKRLQESKTFIPHYYLTEEILCDPLIAVREQFKNLDIKLTINDFVLRAVALALREHKEINTGYDAEKRAIIQFKTVDISLAVEIPDGLITPIIRHADYKNLLELSQEAKILAKKARENALELEEFKGGSFTISNLGMFGIKGFAAIINPPQSAILAVGGMKKVPVVQGDSIVIGHTMVVTLSADHRVIDGASAARFLVTFRKYMENPVALIT
jgi:pyruvate dehydrogenase E2 component (dihydrolipoamide acetyltransferase)